MATFLSEYVFLEQNPPASPSALKKSAVSDGDTKANETNSTSGAEADSTLPPVPDRGVETPSNLFEEQSLDAAFNEALIDCDEPNSSRPSGTHADEFEDNLHPKLAAETDDGLDKKPGTQALINEVDELIAEKFSVDETPPPIRSRADSSTLEMIGSFEEGGLDGNNLFVLDDEALLDRPTASHILKRWLLTPFLLICLVLLTMMLIYQLWLRQAIPILEHELVSEKVAPMLGQVRKIVGGAIDREIPVRRDLLNLRLLSARLEPHPSRPSTTLLKVSLVNKSTITQPYPWLELILSDEHGRLVSRRALSPDDYLYNNRLRSVIGPNELRKVTIELLAFPRQAHGYELKIVNR